MTNTLEWGRWCILGFDHTSLTLSRFLTDYYTWCLTRRGAVYMFWELTRRTQVTTTTQFENHFGIRFQGTHRSDQGVTGPYTYGKGKQWIDHTATGNRSLCVRTTQRLHLVEAALYKTPSQLQQITYRDKAAPPADWSQYLPDPLIMQQFYAKLQQQDRDHSLVVASHIRSFLDLPQPLPASKKQPIPDPVRFQRLDHTFVRTQWLSGVNSCRSKLHTGFPSDHYLLVTEIQVKLAQRMQPSHPRLRFDFRRTTIDQRYSFNQAFREAMKVDNTGAATQCVDEVPTAPRPHLRIFTDGSGSKGKATASTAAGWGWTYQAADQSWTSASGPVITSRDHTAFLGAIVLVLTIRVNSLQSLRRFCIVRTLATPRYRLSRTANGLSI